MSNLDNQPDSSRTEVQKGNAQAEVMRKLIQSKFPRTDRLLNGIRFQLPVRRQADYPNHEYAAYWDGQLLMDGLTAYRKLLGDPTRWKPIAGAFLVTNEWLKLDQRTFFVERELGEALKRTDLPAGFCPQDLRLAMERFCVWFFRRGSSGAKGKYSRAMFRRPLGISHPLP